MKKIRHRLMAIIMLFVMLFSNSSWAAITANAQTGSNGSCYSATLNIWKSSTKVYDTGYVDHTKLISLYANSMIIQNEDDYTITLKMRFPKSIVYFGILNPEKDGTADWRYTAGTKSWLNGYDYNSAKVPAKVRAGAIEENNDNWLDYTIKTDENTGYSTVTFNVADISKDIFVMFATVGVANKITMKPISCIDIYEQSSVQLDLSNAKKAEQVDYLISNSDLKGYFSGRSASWEVEDSVATATIPFDASVLTAYTNVTFKDETGTEIDSSGGKITLKYDLTDYEDLAFGKTITFTGTNSAGKSVTYVTSVVPYYNNIQDVTLEEEITGTKIETDSSILPATAKLVTEEIADDSENTTDPYSVIMDALGTNMKNMYMYNWKISYENGTETNRTYQNVKLMFKVPEGWDPNNTQLLYYDINQGFAPNVEGNIETDAEGNSYFVIYTQKLCYYALYELNSLQPADKEMANGTYEVPVSVYHLTKEGQLSMADQCLSDTAKVVVKDGVKTLYLGFSPVSIYDEFSYMTKMWLYGSDYTKNGSTPSGSLNPVIFTSYYKNDEGSYLTDVFNEGTLNYYPSEGYVQLVSDEAQWPARFKVPIMDAIGGGNFEQDAWVTIYWGRAEKISDETPDVPIANALVATIDIAKTASQVEYSAESWAALETAYKNACAITNENSIEEMTAAYQELRSALDGLEAPKAMGLDAGLYTAAGKIGKTEIVTEARVLVNEDGSAYIDLGVNGITALYYYDLNEKAYQGTSLEILTDENQNQTVVGAGFNLPVLNSSVAIMYKDTNEDTYSAVLSFSDFEKQSVDKTALAEALAEADAKLKEAAEDSTKYEAAKVSALQAAAAEAALVNNHAVALQTEVDAQTEAVKQAISELMAEINLDALRAAVEEAKAINADGYTPSSYASFSSVITEAENLLAQETQTGVEIEAMLIKLSAAREGLIEKADKTELQKVYDEASALTNDMGYAGWDTLQSVLTEAKTVLEDENADQNTVNAHYNAIVVAVNNLSGGIDKTVLADLISQAEALDVSGYSDASVAMFESAIVSAKAVLEDAAATQQEVEKQIQLLMDASKALLQKEDENVVYEGTYEITGRMWHAAADQASMGNAALKQPMQVIVGTDEETGETTVTLRMEYAPLTTSLGTSDFTGYLAVLNYFPEWEGGETGYQMPTGEEPVSANVESYYEETYDVYNDPENGTDAKVKGKLYPHYMTLPVELGDGEIWVQVYVPVMEAISEGSGLQYARLQLDWTTLTQIEGAADTDEATAAEKAALTKELETAKALDTTGADEEDIAMLGKAMEAAQAVLDNHNVDAAAVTATREMLASAVAVFSEEAVEADKTELEKAIEAADSYLNNPDVKYTETTRQILQNARGNASSVLEDEQATQTQVNHCIEAIDLAIQSLIVDGTDKTELRKALDAVVTYLDATDLYTAASLDMLRSLYDTANAVYEGEATQEEVNAQVRILNYAASNLTPVEEVSVEKNGLHDMIAAAANQVGKESLYTAESIQNLKKTIEKAEELYLDPAATQEEVNAQASALFIAILNLEQLPADTSSGTGSGTNSGTNSGTDSGNEGTDDDDDNDSDDGSLDRYDLADGIYSITGKMVKSYDTDVKSMANDAINHNVMLTVKDGTYYLTLDFCGLNISGKYGYLGTLKYYATGYTLSGGALKGNLKSVTVNSYQKDSDGDVIEDSYGTNYPNSVTFKMIPEALDDGLVPLQVFVPIMESISSGTGTQPVFLKLSWSTLEKTTADDDAFDDNTSDDESDDETTVNTNSLLQFTSTLQPSGTSLTAGSTLKAASTLKSGTTGLKSTTSSLKTSGLSGLSSNGATESTLKGLGDLNGTEEAAPGAGTYTGTAAQTGSANPVTETEEPVSALPMISGIVIALAGLLYKLKGKKFFGM